MPRSEKNAACAAPDQLAHEDHNSELSTHRCVESARRAVLLGARAGMADFGQQRGRLGQESEVREPFRRPRSLGLGWG
ncbi:MAG: hypothetical protein R3B96_15760 [Pirellulaceae bacterium]|nr:hypothetical protein [Planctomycetales bacterium]